MKNTKIRRLLVKAVVCLLIAMVLVPVASVSAVSDKTDEIGYETYTYWYNFTGTTRRVVPSKPMYEVSKVYTSQELSVTGSSSISDTHVSNSGITYALDGGASRVLVIDKDYSIKETWEYIKQADGQKIYFKGAQGIFVDDNENVYIADTSNARVIKCDPEGNFIRYYYLPDSHLIPDNFNYQPIKVAVDAKGYVYILSNGSYYGAILYSPETETSDGEFLGFYGSNDVAATFVQALTTLWNRLFVTNEMMSEQVSALPFTFNDLWIDGEGFVYTVTGNSVQDSQVKRLNPGGSNILDSDGINFVDDNVVKDPLNPNTTRTPDLTGIAADDDGFIYVLDKYYGRIYIYDDECTMITAFGGGLKSGDQDGTFYNPNSISYNKETQDIIVTDNSQNTITVFKITEHGKLIKSAQAKTIVGDYEEAMAEWTDVLEADRNCQLAYAGLAKAYYVMGKNETDETLATTYNDKAIELAKSGYDRETYALAFDRTRTEWLRSNFTWGLLIAVVLIAGLIALLVYSTKHKMRLVKNEKVHLATTMLTHPFENFREIKEKNLTSVPICLVVIILYYVFDVLETTMGGFAFTYFDPSSYNALLVILKTVGLVILWTVTNWAVCTLFSGKGKMKEIFTVICYSLIPSLVGSVIYIICSNVLVPDEAAFLDVLLVICTAYTILLLAGGSIIVHDYSLSKFIGTTLLTLVGCAIVIFLLVAVGILLQQLGGFIGTLYTEIVKLF